MAIPKLNDVKGGKRPGAPKLNPMKRIDPLAKVEYTDDLEVDSASELDAMQQAYRDRAAREDERRTQATDTEFWLCLVFADRAEKEAFLAEFALSPLGDKYLMGDRVAVALRER